MVYWLYADVEIEYDLKPRALDGDVDKIELVDATPDDGAPIYPNTINIGRPIKSEFVPTRAVMEAPKGTLPDLLHSFAFFVDDKFMAVLERLEPGVHQFFPIEIFWEDGTYAASRYWFQTCNRLDSVDPETTTVPRGNRTWLMSKGGDFVFSKKNIGPHHAWEDMRIQGGGRSLDKQRVC
jgi:hypothetical protein